MRTCFVGADDSVRPFLRPSLHPLRLSLRISARTGAAIRSPFAAGMAIHPLLNSKKPDAAVRLRLVFTSPGK